MAIDLESRIGIILQDENLPQAERTYLEELRAENANFLEENKGKLYPISPYYFGETHIRCMADIRIGTVYSLYESSDEDQSFQEKGKMVITRIFREFGEWTAHGPFRFDYQIVENGREAKLFGRRDAWELGLEPIPRNLLEPKVANLPLTSIWIPDTYLSKVELPK